CGMGLVCLANGIIGRLTGDPLMSAYVLTVVAMGGAIVLPWGVRAQVGIVSFAVVGLVIGLGPSLGRWSPNLLVAVVSTFGASVWAAATLERQRLAKKRVELLQAGQKRVLELVARDAPLADVLDEILRTIEEQCPGMLSSVLLVDDDGSRLRHAVGRRLPDEYNRAVDGLMIGPDVGSCGSAAYHRAAVVCEDVATDPRWERFRDLALSYGLRACWSQPIIAGDGTVLGTLAMYYRVPSRPTPGEVAVVELG